MVLGFISQGQDSQVVVQACSREMPKVEGFGVQQFPLFPKPWVNPEDNMPYNKKVMIFSAHAKALDYAAASLVSSTSNAWGANQGAVLPEEEKANSKLGIGNTQ